jgi:hypothetical protein
MPQRSLVAMVALREWAPDWLGRVQAALEAGRGDLPPVEVRRQEGTLAFYWGAEKLIVSAVGEPIPWTDLEGPCNSAWYWPEAARALRGHAAHLLVLAVPAGPDRKPAAMKLTKVASALAECCPAAGVFWGGSGTVHAPGPFRETAALAASDRLPIEIWVGFGLIDEPDGSHSLFTSGLEEFGLMELEIQRSPNNPQFLYQHLFDMVHYVLRNHAILHDGETIGISDEERILIKTARSLCDGDTEVLQLQM